MNMDRLKPGIREMFPSGIVLSEAGRIFVFRPFAQDVRKEFRFSNGNYFQVVGFTDQNDLETTTHEIYKLIFACKLYQLFE